MNCGEHGPEEIVIPEYGDVVASTTMARRDFEAARRAGMKFREYIERNLPKPVDDNRGRLVGD